MNLGEWLCWIILAFVTFSQGRRLVSARPLPQTERGPDLREDRNVVASVQ